MSGMVFAQLGSVEISMVPIFDGIEIEHPQNYAEHAVLDGKPKLQWMGSGLTEYTIDYALHSAFLANSSPKQAFGYLKSMSDKHQAIPFILGDGTYLGYYVITNLTENYEFMSPEGMVISTKGVITLKEWVPEDESAVLAAKAKAKEIAVKNSQSYVGEVKQVPVEEDLADRARRLTNEVRRAIMDAKNLVDDTISTITGPFNEIMLVYGSITGDLGYLAGILSEITGRQISIPGVTTPIGGPLQKIATGPSFLTTDQKKAAILRTPQ